MLVTKEDIIQRTKKALVSGKYSQTRNPGTSVVRLVMSKIMILLLYIARNAIEYNLIRHARASARAARGSSIGHEFLVIANGPSTGRLNSKKVREFQDGGGKVVVINWFLESSLGEEVTPDYYVLSDPSMAPSQVGDDRVANLWNSLMQIPNITVVVPHNWAKEVRKLGPVNILAFNDTELIGFGKSVRLDRPRGYISMTAFKALALALWLTDRHCFIIGFDNSMFLKASVDADNRLYEESNHFYVLSETGRTDMSLWYPMGMEDYLYDQARLFHYLRKCFSFPRILNTDENSLTDVFSKADPYGFLSTSI